MAAAKAELENKIELSVGAITLPTLDPRDVAAAAQDVIKAHIDEMRPALVEEVSGVIPALVSGEVAKAVAALPPAKNGTSVTVEDVAPLIKDLVTTAVEAIEPPEPKEVDPAMVKQLVNEAVASIPAPRDGKDVDPEVVKQLVTDAVAALPTPRDGKDVDPAEVKRMIDETVAALPKPRDGKDIDPEDVKRMIAEAIAELPAPKDGKDVDPAEIKAMVDAAVSAIPAPKDGKDADPEEIRSMVSEAVQKAVSDLPAPRDGKDVDPEEVKRLIAQEVAKIPAPKDGKDVDPEEVKRLVASAVSEIPAPKDGRDIDPEEVKQMIAAAVAEIPRPRDGVDVDMAAVAEMVKSEAGRLVAEIPRPKDGESVTIEDVVPVLEEIVQERIKAIPPAQPGVGISDAIIDHDGKLILILDDGAKKEVGTVVGRDVDRDEVRSWIELEIKKIPAPRDGVDGLSFDDFNFDLKQVGDRDFTLSWTNGQKTVERNLYVPAVIFRGLWNPDGAYKRFDSVTFAGNSWVAMKDDVTSKPDGSNPDWQLSVKRGRDGKSVPPADTTLKGPIRLR
jgi:hypothetical protein